MAKDKSWDYFFEIYEKLPRQGPGDGRSTLKALDMLPVLDARKSILDIGCGSGAQTIDLAMATDARIVAVDNHPPFIDQLVRRAADLGLEDRVKGQVGDMNDLPFPEGSFDVVWSEGSIFIMGFARGLASWRRLLKPGGFLVVSEFCWLRDNPPAELWEIFRDGGGDVGDVQSRRDAVAPSGYRLLDDFVLPSSVGWWENYYVPLAACLEQFRKAHEKDPEALDVASGCRREIDLYLKYPDAFGYVFFVMERRE